MKITLQEEELSKLPYERYTNVKEINENISLSPTIGIEIKSKKDLDIVNREVLPANVVVRINKNLEVINDNCEFICIVDDLMQMIEGKIIPVFDVRDRRTADKLAEYLQRNNIEDVSMIAEEGEIIKRAKDKYSIIRGILKFPYEEPLEENRILEIVQETNRSKAKTVLLPSNRINNEVAEYMQKRLVTLWGISYNNTELENHKLITAGVNGIVTGNIDTAVNALNKYDRDTLVRKPFIIGHRGNPSLAPENTLEGAKIAYENGADIIENDIYLTKDNEIVIMHDETLDRTTNGTGNVESYRLKELKEFKVNKQFPDKYPDARIPTLREYFEEFKDKDIVHFIEIKSYKSEIVKELKKLVKEMGVEEQIVVISFSEAQIKEMNRLMPEVSVGYLNSINVNSGDVRGNIWKVFKCIQHVNATFNPSYTNINKELLEELKHRGSTVWPWTYRNINNFVDGYKMGVYGLTTDYAQWSSNLVEHINPEKKRYNINKGEEVQVKAIGRTYKRENVDVNIEIIPIENPEILKINTNKIEAIGEGKSIVILKSTIKIGDKDSYNIYSEPVEINIK